MNGRIEIPKTPAVAPHISPEDYKVAKHVIEAHLSELRKNSRIFVTPEDSPEVILRLWREHQTPLTEVHGVYDHCRYFIWGISPNPLPETDLSTTTWESMNIPDPTQHSTQETKGAMPKKPKTKKLTPSQAAALKYLAENPSADFYDLQRAGSGGGATTTKIVALGLATATGKGAKEWAITPKGREAHQNGRYPVE
jgi:hypothetical protein